MHACQSIFCNVNSQLSFLIAHFSYYLIGGQCPNQWLFIPSYRSNVLVAILECMICTSFYRKQPSARRGLRPGGSLLLQRTGSAQDLSVGNAHSTVTEMPEVPKMFYRMARSAERIAFVELRFYSRRYAVLDNRQLTTDYRLQCPLIMPEKAFHTAGFSVL
jgi:hypothetical protein